MISPIIPLGEICNITKRVLCVLSSSQTGLTHFLKREYNKCYCANLYNLVTCDGNLAHRTNSALLQIFFVKWLIPNICVMYPKNLIVLLLTSSSPSFFWVFNLFLLFLFLFDLSNTLEFYDKDDFKDSSEFPHLVCFRCERRVTEIESSTHTGSSRKANHNIYWNHSFIR